MAITTRMISRVFVFISVAPCESWGRSHPYSRSPVLPYNPQFVSDADRVGGAQRLDRQHRDRHCTAPRHHCTLRRGDADHLAVEWRGRGLAAGRETELEARGSD